MFDYEYIKKENKCVLGSAIKIKMAIARYNLKGNIKINYCALVALQNPYYVA